MQTPEVARPEAARRHVVIVGGGIAGLSAAWFLRQQEPEVVDVTVLEGSPQVGGKLRVSDVGGLPVDEGAEAMLNRRPEGVELARAVGLADDLRYPASTSAGVWSYGATRPVPTGTIMGVPTDLDAVRDTGVLSEQAVRRAAADLECPGTPMEGDVAIGRYVAERVGREVTERLVEPFLGGVYAGHADELSLDATVPALGSAARQHGSLIMAARAVRDATPTAPASTQPTPVPVFAGIDGGVGRLATALADALRTDGVRLRTEAMVRRLERVADGWRLIVGPTRFPETVEADAVVLACPASPAGKLLADVLPYAAAELDAVDYASVAVVTAVYRASALPADLTGSGILVPPIEQRRIKAVTLSSRKWEWLAERDPDLVALRCSVGRHREVADLRDDDAELTARALADFGELTGVTSPPIDTRVTRWGGGLPQYTVGHRDRVQRIRDDVATVPGLAVCGAGYDGLGIPACIASAKQAAARAGTTTWPATSTP